MTVLRLKHMLSEQYVMYLSLHCCQKWSGLPPKPTFDPNIHIMHMSFIACHQITYKLNHMSSDRRCSEQELAILIHVLQYDNVWNEGLINCDRIRLWAASTLNTSSKAVGDAIWRLVNMHSQQKCFHCRRLIVDGWVIPDVAVKA